MLNLTIVGHIGQDARTNTVQDKKVINFSVAHTTKFKDKDGKEQSRTTWVECAWWTDRKIENHLLKGTQVAITGRPTAETYEDRNKIIQPKLSCSVEHLELLSSKKDKDSNDSNPLTNEEPSIEAPPLGEGY